MACRSSELFFDGGDDDFAPKRAECGKLCLRLLVPDDLVWHAAFSASGHARCVSSGPPARRPSAEVCEGAGEDFAGLGDVDAQEDFDSREFFVGAAAGLVVRLSRIEY